MTHGNMDWNTAIITFTYLFNNFFKLGRIKKPNGRHTAPVIVA